MHPEGRGTIRGESDDEEEIRGGGDTICERADGRGGVGGLGGAGGEVTLHVGGGTLRDGEWGVRMLRVVERGHQSGDVRRVQEVVSPLEGKYRANMPRATQM